MSEQTQKTYRAYVLDTSNAQKPVAHVVYVRAVDYRSAWMLGRAALNADKRGKHVAEAAGKASLWLDAACEKPFTLTGDNVAFVKCDSERVRNVKIDVAALRAALTDPKATAEQKLAAATALAGL